MDKRRIALVCFLLSLLCLLVVDKFVGADAEPGIMVVIDPGHGGQDSGSTYDGVEEKTLNLNIALYLAEELDNRGITYKLTREEDVFVGLTDRADMANQCEANLFISIHHNAIKNAPSANGTETLYYPSKKDEPVFTGEQFAAIVQRHLVEELGTRDRGVIARTNLAVIRRTNMTACIAEIGYMSNDNERGLMVTESFQRHVAKALADAIQEALATMRVRSS